MKRKIYSTILVIGLIGSLLAGCGNKKAEEANNGKEIINPGDPIIVSTMNDTEGEILGRMMVLALEDAGYEVTDNTFGYQGTVNGRTALLEGETDIYMDYTGRGLRLIEGVDPALYSKMDTAFESISTWDKENNNLIWMTYAPYSNTDGLAVTKEFSKKNNVKTLVDLADYIKDLPETTCFLFIETEVDKRSKLFKAVKAKGSVVEMNFQDEATLKRWTAGCIQREGKKITERDVIYFLEKVGTDMENITKELEKIFCYTLGRDVIAREDIDAVCVTQISNHIFEMVNAVAEKKQKKALDLYYELLALKEPPMRILFLMMRQYRNLFQVKGLMKKRV